MCSRYGIELQIADIEYRDRLLLPEMRQIRQEVVEGPQDFENQRRDIANLFI